MPSLHELLATALGHHRAGRLDEARTLYSQIIRTDARHADAWHLLGMLLFQSGQTDVAIDCLDKAVQFGGPRADVLANRGIVLRSVGRMDDAEVALRSALQLAPDHIDALNTLGVVRLERDGLDEAATLFEQVLALRPGHLNARSNLGNVFKKQKRYVEAEREYRCVLQQVPDRSETLANLAAVLIELRRYDEAIALSEQVLRQQPDLAEARINLGDALRHMDRAKDAVEQLQIVADQHPDRVAGNLGTALLSAQRPSDALTWLERAVEIEPDNATAWSSLASARLRTMQTDGALAAYRRACELQPDNPLALSNHIYGLEFHPDVTQSQLFELYRQWDQRFVAPLSSPLPTGERVPDGRVRGRVDGNRRLRLGIIAPNLRQHPAAFLILPVLEALDRDRFELVIYYDHASNDSVTQRVRGMAAQWHDVFMLTHEELAERIRNDAIDVLVVMAGHTEGNRLLVAARRPAPVQIGWTGDPSGLTCFDGLIVDRYLVPDEIVPLYGQPLIFMPHDYATFEPPADCPPIGPAPYAANGFITFGSFNQTVKYHFGLIETWAAILQATPYSKLMLGGTDVIDNQSRLQAMFAACGIASDRLILKPRVLRYELLDWYNQIDIALDPYPFSGGVTTIEALWMGVPVITLPWDTFAGRTSLTHLSNIGLTETIATDRDNYIRLSIELATAPDRITHFKQTLRDQVLASPLCDGPQFARQFEQALRELWHRWCCRQTTQVVPGAALKGRQTEAHAKPQRRKGQADGSSGSSESMSWIVPHSNAHSASDVGAASDSDAWQLLTVSQLGELGTRHRLAARYADAIRCFERALELQPDSFEATGNLGLTYADMGRFADAEQQLQHTIRLRPGHPVALSNLGWVLTELGRPEEATPLLEEATRKQPDFADAWGNLGNALRDTGRHAEASRACERAIALNPQLTAAHSNRIYVEQFIPGVTAARMAELYRAWDRQHVQPLTATVASHTNDRSPDRRLRVGLVSANLREHPCGYFLVRVLEAIDSTHLEVTVYSDDAVDDARPVVDEVTSPATSAVDEAKSPGIQNADLGPGGLVTSSTTKMLEPSGSNLTARCRSAVPAWKEARGVSDAALADAIRRDRIDILIVTGGHTNRNRLLLTARRPAPVILSWTGDPAGISSVDWLVADERLVPSELERHYTERILRMPDGYVTFDPPANAPPVGPLPCSTNGIITFGSCNQATKYHSDQLAVWARIMAAVPDSRLLLIGKAVPANRERILAPFTAAGIGTDRIELSGTVPRRGIFDAWSRTDIALDPFPFSGGVTTIEAMWMGVPTITLPGETLASRTALTHLVNVGLPELVAASPDDYVQRTVALANDRARLLELRSTLRQRMAASPLCDGPRFARHFEAALQAVWHDWLQNQRTQV